MGHPVMFNADDLAPFDTLPRLALKNMHPGDLLCLGVDRWLLVSMQRIHAGLQVTLLKISGGALGLDVVFYDNRQPSPSARVIRNG